MKKFVSLFLAVLLGITLISCGQTSNVEQGGTGTSMSTNKNASSEKA